MNNVEFFNKSYQKLNVVGDYVLIDRMDPSDIRMSDGIYIPDVSRIENTRIGIGRIAEINEAEAEKIGVKTGDIVLYDFHAAHNTRDKMHILRTENVFMVLDEDEAAAFLNGTLNV